MSQQARNSTVGQPDVKPVGVDGGLNVKTDPISLKPPSTTRADNAWYVTPGQVKQLPAFASVLPTAQATNQQVLLSHNLGTRDPQGPSVNGDVLYHTEVYDNVSNVSTSPVLMTNINPATKLGSITPELNNVADGQPVFPFVTRQEAFGNFATAVSASTTPCPSYLGVTQWTPDSSGLIRYAIVNPNTGVTLNSNASMKVLVGFLATRGESNTALFELFTSATPTVLWAGAEPIAGTSNFVVAYAVNTGSLNLSYQTVSFVTGSLTTVNLGTVATNTDGSPAVDMFVHNSQTYLIYVPNAGTLTVLNIGTGVSTTTFTGAPAIIGAGSLFSASPTSNTTAPTYFGLLVNRTLYVCSLNAGAFSVRQTQTLPNVSSSATNTTRYTRQTGAVLNIGGPLSGTLGVSLNFVCYYPVFESYGHAAPATNNTVAEQVCCTPVQYIASTNTVTLGTANVFRNVGGAEICGRAFQNSPAELSPISEMGPKNTFCPVRTGSRELSSYAVTTTNPQYGQPTYFLLDHQARPAARWAEGQAPVATLTGLTGIAETDCCGLSRPLFLASPNDLSVQDIFVPYALQTNTAFPSSIITLSTSVPVSNADATPLNPQYLVGSLTLSMQSQVANPPIVQAGKNNLLTGTMSALYDGRQTFEANWHWACQNLNGTVTPSGTAQFYYYAAIWKWVDAQGLTHRSAPSKLFLATTSGTLTAGSLIIPAPYTSRFTGVNTAAVYMNDITCEIYRSITAYTDQTCYYVGNVPAFGMPTGLTSPPLDGGNNFPSMYLSFTDPAIADSSLTARPRLYTSVNSNAAATPYPSNPPPPFIWQCAAKGRVFGLAQVVGQYRVYYSSIWSAGIPIEWNAFNYQVVPPEIGDARSVEAIDDKIVIFGTRRNAYFYGDGPPPSNAAGIPNPGDGFSPVYPLPTPAGVLGTGTPVVVPDGIIFQGSSGFQLLGRDLTIKAAGAEVDPITGRQVGNTGTVFGRGTLLPGLQSVVWANPAGAALVYNYLLKKWSTWPLLSNTQSLAQRLDGTVFAAIQPISGSQLLPASTGGLGADFGTLGSTFSFNSPTGTPAGLVLETPWIPVGTGPSGDGELWEAMLLGTWLGSHTLQVETALNYGAYSANGAAPQVFPLTTAPANGYQFRVTPPSTSQVRAVRYRVSLLPTSSLQAQYAMANISDFVIYAGSMQGTTRLSGGSSR